MGRFIYGKTKNCCVCLKPATVWAGWLWKSRDGIRAGFCKEHISEDQQEEKRHGCYNKEMGEIIKK